MNKVLAVKRDAFIEGINEQYGDNPFYADVGARGFDAGVSATKEYYDEMIFMLVKTLQLINDKTIHDPLIIEELNARAARVYEISKGAIAAYEKWKA